MPTRPAVPSGGAPVQPPARTPPVAPAVTSDEPPRAPEAPAGASALPPAVRPPVLPPDEVRPEGHRMRALRSDS